MLLLKILNKIFGGSRFGGSWSTTRITFFGSITYMVFLSTAEFISFWYAKEFHLMIDLLNTWFWLVLVSGVLVRVAGALPAFVEIAKAYFQNK